MISEDQAVTHESYAMVQFSRISRGGSVRLFGSSIKNHMQTIELRIYEGRRTHGLGYDRYSAGSMRPIATVELSATQFAELLTTMNIGSGVPGTLRYFNGKEMKEPPDDIVEVERIQNGFAERMSAFVKQSVKTRGDIHTLLVLAKVSTKHAKSIMGQVDQLVQEIGANAPFFLRQFEEAAQKIVTTVKAEADAWVTGMITNTGLKELKRMAQSDKLLEEKNK